MKNSNINIPVWLGIGFGSLLLIVTVAGISNSRLINKVDHNLEVIVTNRYVRTEKSYEALLALNKVKGAVMQSVLIDNQFLDEQAFKDIQTGYREYSEAIAEIKTLDMSVKGKALIAKLKNVTRAATRLNDKVMELETAGLHEEAIDVLVQELIPANQNVTDVFAELLKYQQEQMQTTCNVAIASGVRARLANILFGIVSTIIDVVTADYDENDGDLTGSKSSG